MSKIKSIFKHIPGYRSSTKLNEVMATLYYLFFLIFLIINIALGNINTGIIKICISGLTLPFMIFFIMDISNKK